MNKQKLFQDEIDKIVVAERVVALPTVCGVGFNDVAFQNRIGERQIWQYRLWVNLLSRCFCDKFKAKHPAYQDVTCCDEWLSFATFLEWLNKEVGYSGRPNGSDLDKDIVIKGNKAYSPETCSFVPQAVNKLLTDSGATRGEWPVGVRFHENTGSFHARMSCNSKSKHLGPYKTPEEAFAVYKIAKEAQIKVVAMQHKDVLKPTVFESLMSWEIEP